MTVLSDKIKGALYGLAIGDAVGGTTEFMKPKVIKEKYGVVKDMLGGGAHNLAVGEVTDDTAMTIAVARGILKNPDKPVDEIGKEFLKWADTMPKDMGITVASAINYYRRSKDWFKAAETVDQAMFGQTAGNGTLMRCLPVALGYKDPQKMRRITIVQSKMTHYDEKAAEACLIYNFAVADILEGKSLQEALADNVKGTRYERYLTERPKNGQTGYVVDTMNWVVYILNNMKSYKQAILRATNNGLDSDTVAAIVGGMYGAYVGFDNLPNSWKEKILVKKELDSLSDKLLIMRTEI